MMQDLAGPALRVGLQGVPEPSVELDGGHLQLGRHNSPGPSCHLQGLPLDGILQKPKDAGAIVAVYTKAGSRGCQSPGLRGRGQMWSKVGVTPGVRPSCS